MSSPPRQGRPWGVSHGIAKYFPWPCEIDQSGLVGNDEGDVDHSIGGRLEDAQLGRARLRICPVEVASCGERAAQCDESENPCRFLWSLVNPLPEEFANRTSLRLHWNVSNDNYPAF